MKNIGALVFLLIVVANVIGSFMQKRSEKARKQQQGIDQSGHTAQRSPASSAPSASPGQSRLERLAARRQAQLEELRGRREERGSATSTQQARIGPGPAPQPTPTASPTVFRAPGPQPTTPMTRPATARPSVTLPSAARKSHPQPAQRRRVSRQPTVQPIEAKGFSALRAEPSPRATPKAAPKPFLSLDSRTITPQLLRRLVVLKEIFDAPIALRNRDIWDRPG